MGRQDVSHQSVDDGSQQNAADVVSMAHEVANRKCTLQAVAQHVPVRPLELDSVHGSMTPSPIRTMEGVNIDRATSREDQDGYLSTEDTSGEGGCEGSLRRPSACALRDGHGSRGRSLLANSSSRGY